MPVLVIGADTVLGEAVIDALAGRGGEIRAFVTNVDAADRFRRRGVKVAVGDVSDASHIGGAGLNTYSAVLVAQATSDDRERSFAAEPEAVAAAWADGLREAGVTRAIWLEHGAAPSAAVAAAVAEFVSVATDDRSPADIAADVARYDEAGTLPAS